MALRQYNDAASNLYVTEDKWARKMIMNEKQIRIRGQFKGTIRDFTQRNSGNAHLMGYHEDGTKLQDVYKQATCGCSNE